jgi:hypothetical protein
MARNDSGLRWTVVSIENGEGAKEALDRITIPKDVLDRIGPTALPRSSIVISDEPLSKETNYRTEFVAVLNDQPQGGFITRKPTTNIMASGSDDGFGSFFQRGWQPQSRQTAGQQPRQTAVQQGWGWDPQPQPPQTGNPRRRGGGQSYQQVQPGWQPMQGAW